MSSAQVRLEYSLLLCLAVVTGVCRPAQRRLKVGLTLLVSDFPALPRPFDRFLAMPLEYSNYFLLFLVLLYILLHGTAASHGHENWVSHGGYHQNQTGDLLHA